MKKMNNKGFTIVELVIVIAVIAILAAVMIPTFSSIVSKAQDSAALQKATAAYKEAYANALSDGVIDTSDSYEISDITFAFSQTAGKISCTATADADFGYTIAISADGVVSVTRVQAAG